MGEGWKGWKGSFAVEARGLGILPEGVYGIRWDHSREISWLGPRAVALIRTYTRQTRSEILP